MQVYLKAITILLVWTGCKNSSGLPFNSFDQHQVIALQPLGNYDSQQLKNIQYNLKGFFKKKIIVLKPIEIPDRFRSPYEKRFSADSLLNMLSDLKNDSFAEMIGITHQDIYELKAVEVNRENRLASTFIYNRIRGLAFVNESVCIVSDFTLRSADLKLWSNRVNKAILHEVGHNLGLKHCNVDSCLMLELNGSIVNLNIQGGGYCDNCKKVLR